MRILILIAVAFTLAGVALPAAKKPVAKKTAAKKTATKKAGTSKAKGKPAPKAPAATWRTRQQYPSADRYKEIQQALVDKGFLKSEADGVWSAASVDAMRSFQSSQKLTANGKITAPALIALGLGPVHQERPTPPKAE